MEIKWEKHKGSGLTCLLIYCFTHSVFHSTADLFTHSFHTYQEQNIGLSITGWLPQRHEAYAQVAEFMVKKIVHDLKKCISERVW